MAQKAATTRPKAKKGKKRGPKEEVLIITEDPEVALALLLRPKPTKKT